MPGGAEPEKGVTSPCTGAALPQGISLVSFGQSSRGVIARVRRCNGGDEHEIAVNYLITVAVRTASSATGSTALAAAGPAALAIHPFTAALLLGSALVLLGHPERRRRHQGSSRKQHLNPPGGPA